LMTLDGLQQRLGVADRGDDLLAGIGQETGDACSQQHRVLGDHDPHGSSTSTEVGPPTGLSTWIQPPSACTRSASPNRPVPLSGSAPPLPSSLTSIARRSPRRAMLTRADVASACFATFVSASVTT